MVLALADTARRYGIEPALFHDFMSAMSADLTVTDYADYAALRGYMHGSAAVIGLQMLPVLGTVVPREEAAPYAAELGVAFQLSNFLRDVGEDLDRGRVYLPADLLAGHGVDRGTAAVEPGHRPARAADHVRAARVRGADPRCLPSGAARPRHAGAGVAPLYPDRVPAVPRHSRRGRPGRPPCCTAARWSQRRRRAAVAADGLARAVAARLRGRAFPGAVSAARSGTRHVPARREGVM